MRKKGNVVSGKRLMVIYLIVGHVTLGKIIKKSNGLDRFLFFVVLIGVVVTLISLFRGITLDRQVQVEYLKGGSSIAGANISKIFVDIEGAVMTPGVYQMDEGSRIKDVMVMAGGLSNKADRDYCEKNINMAEQLKDGQKIFIPETVDTNATQGYPVAKSGTKLISINSATAAELDTLWGIGAARAESIVKNRPYQSVDDLVTKGILTKTILERDRNLLSVY